MKLRHLFFLIVLASCQKEQKTAQTTDLNTVTTSETVLADTKESERSLQTDTISISEDKKTEVNYILANLIEQKADKDSIVTSKYRLDFYQNKNKIASSKITLKNYEKGSEWYASTGLTDTSNKNSSFIKIDFGYAACGYTHENYLYYIKKGDLQLVHQWQSMSDSGWGSWTEFVSSKTGKDPETFYCKTVSFEPGEEDSEDSGIVTYSDSISFSLKGEHWKKQLLSVKDKPYFEKKMTFNEFHKQD